MITSHRASLSITSLTHPAAMVTDLLGMQPDRVHEIGDRRGRSGTFGHSVWILEGLEAAGSEPDSFGRLEDLARRLGGREAAFERLREHYHARIEYSGFSDSMQGGFFFPAEAMATLGALGCDILGTAYLDDDYSEDPGDVGVIEHALLPVRPGTEREFEAAFDEARHIIAGTPGFRSLTLSRGVESSSHYLLLVEWASLEAHETGFRGSPEYERWRELLHRFYDPFPEVVHFTRVTSATPGPRSVEA
jgi:heme-degrading monooxygenase HmoA